MCKRPANLSIGNITSDDDTIWWLDRQDEINLFHRLVIARRKNFNQDSFEKATGKLRKTLRSSSQATTCLWGMVFTSLCR